MDREYVRTCSADQAAILAAAAGRTARIGPFLVRIDTPTGHLPIDPVSTRRYVARIELLASEQVANGTAGRNAVDVVTTLFGMYLDDSAADSPGDARPPRRTPAAA